MFGSATSLVGRRLDSVLPQSVGTWGVEHAGSRVIRYETVARRGDGQAFPAEVALSELELDGEPAQLAVVTDISWRKETEEIRDRFIGVLSHELRTPITSIYGGAQLLLARGDQLAQATRNELLADVAGEADRLATDGRKPADPRARRTRRRCRRRRPRPAAAHPAQRPLAREGDVGIDEADDRDPGRAAVRGRGRGLHRAGPAEPHLECRQVRGRRRRRPRLGQARARRRDRGPGPGRRPGHRSGRGGPPVHAVLPVRIDCRGTRLRDRSVRLPGADRRDGWPGLGDGRARSWSGVRFQPAALRRGWRA